MIQPIILEKLKALPESMQTEVLHYIEFLLEKHQKSKQKSLDDLRQNLQGLTEEEAEKRYGYGSMAGQIIMADDFDEPLEDLAEYM
ncbi:MAG: type II toxin-antitoxin system VapB family antitoxin [Elainellaceae cyanobacterium]